MLITRPRSRRWVGKRRALMASPMRPSPCVGVCAASHMMRSMHSWPSGVIAGIRRYLVRLLRVPVYGFKV